VENKDAPFRPIAGCWTVFELVAQFNGSAAKSESGEVLAFDSRLIPNRNYLIVEGRISSYQRTVGRVLMATSLSLQAKEKRRSVHKHRRRSKMKKVLKL